MLWLQPFVKAAGTVPPSCCGPAATRWAQQAWASREGRGESLGALGGPGQRGPRSRRMQRWMQWEGSPCGSRDGAAWQEVGGTRDTPAHLPRLSKASWYPQSTSSQPTQWQGCRDRDAAGLGCWAVCQGQHSALIPLGWRVSTNHRRWPS